MAINDTIKISAFFILFLFLFIPAIYLGGCAEINPFETPGQVLKHPLGTDPIRVGMTKDEVISLWGTPDQTNQLEPSDEWKTQREEWIYIGRYSKVPIDRSYLFKTKYLIFDGDNLVQFGTKTESETAPEEER